MSTGLLRRRLFVIYKEGLLGGNNEALYANRDPLEAEWVL